MSRPIRMPLAEVLTILVGASTEGLINGERGDDFDGHMLGGEPNA